VALPHASYAVMHSMSYGSLELKCIFLFRFAWLYCTFIFNLASVLCQTSPGATLPPDIVAIESCLGLQSWQMRWLDFQEPCNPLLQNCL
jgi:hypothetical protein